MPLSSLPREDIEHVLAHTRELWSEVRGRRIFLTGGTGFFGPWLVETFANANDRLDLGAELVVLTRDPAGTSQRLPHYADLRGVTLHGGDVRDFTWPAGNSASSCMERPSPPSKVTWATTVTCSTRSSRARVAR